MIRLQVVGVLALALAACSQANELRLGAPCECPPGVATPCELEACGDGLTCTGTCSLACTTDADCPDGAVCGVMTPGTCEYPCETAADCPAWLDRCAGTCYGGELVTAW